jgi:CBS domain-containing protein
MITQETVPMKAREVIRRSVPSCTPLSSLDDVGRMMYEHDQGAIPVVTAEGKVVGLLTDREIAMAMAAKNRGSAQILARELLGGELVQCGADDAVSDVFLKMKTQRIRNLPVVEADGRFLGVISLEDLAHASLQGGITPDQIVLTLQALGKTRAETGEAVPKWPWVNAASR